MDDLAVDQMVAEQIQHQFGIHVSELPEAAGMPADDVAWLYAEKLAPLEFSQMEGPHGKDIHLDQHQIYLSILRQIPTLSTSASNEDGTSDMSVGDVFEMPSPTHPTNAGTEDDENRVRFQQEASRRVMANDEKQTRINSLRERLEGINLTRDQKKIVAEIESNIMEYRPEFLDTVAHHFQYDFDPGSPWELVEANGSAKLIRKETQDEGPDLSPKHAYHEGQRLMVHSTIMPEEVIIRALKEDGEYQVQSELTGRIFSVVEADLYDEEADSDLFDGEFPVNLGRLFS